MNKNKTTVSELRITTLFMLLSLDSACKNCAKNTTAVENSKYTKASTIYDDYS